MFRKISPALIALLATEAGRGEERFELILRLTDRLMARLARTGATGTAPPEIVPGEAEMLTRLSPDPAAAPARSGMAASAAPPAST